MGRAAASATVLVVDDDEGLSRLIQRALEREGFRVVRASSGQDAIAWLATNRTDLMLLDLKLHDIEGRELINHLAEIQRVTPFVIITGQGDEREAVEMIKRGALDYLVKDVQFIEFVPTVVRRALQQIEKDTQHKQSEEALRLSEANLANAQQVAHVGSYEFDVPGGQRLHWSAETFRIVGLSPAQGELSQKEYLMQVVHPDDRTRVQAKLERTMKGGEHYEAEYRIVRPDGSIRRVHSIAEPLVSPDKKVIKLIGSLQDITERRELEEEVREISDREQRRIGQDLHDVLGQQLTAIGLSCESLRSDLVSACPALEPQAAQICRDVGEAIAQTRVLAHDLAGFRLEAGGLQTALMELARTTTSRARLKCRFECSSAITLAGGPASTQLYFIAQEAVNNAVKHSRASLIVIRLSERKDVLRLEIKDNGKGLRRFGKRGQGMGLRLMQHRAGLVGAELRVRSRAGKGVQVVCTLPRKQ
jgi:PAS domain S-box-containing protein